MSRDWEVRKVAKVSAAKLVPPPVPFSVETGKFSPLKLAALLESFRA